MSDPQTRPAPSGETEERALARACPTHQAVMVPSGKGAVRCPVPVCQEFRQTTCRAFIRRERPAGRTVLCGAPVTHETWALGPARQVVYHGGRCDRHPDTARYAPQAGWRIERRRTTT